MFTACARHFQPLRGSWRAYSRKGPKQLIPSKNRNRLQARPTETKKPKLFAFGNFASLQRPDQRHVDKAESAIDKISTFDALRIFPTVRTAMVGEIKLTYKRTSGANVDDVVLAPSPVQIAAIRLITQPRKVAPQKLDSAGSPLLHDIMEENERHRLKVFTIAAETGSGKTWAYLAPVLLKLKEDDLQMCLKSPQAYEDARQHPHIRAVVLVPTFELIDQVYDTLLRAGSVAVDLEKDIPKNIRTAKDYAEFFENERDASGLNLRFAKWGSGDSHEKLFKLVKKRLDVLVTTPGKIQSLAKLQNIERPFRHFNFVNYCVVDEADTLMDESFFEDTLSVFLRFPKLRDLIMCSATIPKEFEKSLKRLVKDEKSVIRIVTPLIHKIPRQIAVKVIDAQQAPFHGSKTRCLAQALYAIHNDGTEAGYVKRILIFVNERKHVEPLVESLLSKYGHRPEDIIGVTGKDTAMERQEKIAPFLQHATPLEEDIHECKIKVLVTTDLLARGLNFQGIKNVILMDLPRTSIDLIHRIGRTGRMRQSGRVFVIIDKKTRKSWIKGLPNAIRHGSTLG